MLRIGRRFTKENITARLPEIMKRNAFDDRRDIQIANENAQSVMPCTFCNTLTVVEDLNTYGARCFSCYREYCTMGRHYEGLTREMRKDMAETVKRALAGGLRASPREHMRHLAQLESEGKASPAQRGFLAAARSGTWSDADGQ